MTRLYLWLAVAGFLLARPAHAFYVPGHCANAMFDGISGKSKAEFCSPMESTASMILDTIFIIGGPPTLVQGIAYREPKLIVLSPIMTIGGGVGLGLDAAAIAPNAFLRYVWPGSRRRSGSSFLEGDSSWI